MTTATKRTPRIETVLPLTPVQEGLVFHAAYDEDGSALYNVQVVLDLEGPLDAAVLRGDAEWVAATNDGSVSSGRAEAEKLSELRHKGIAARGE